MAARWPEELADLLEDAFVLRDARLAGSLFVRDATAVLDDAEPVRGRDEVVRRVANRWTAGRTFSARTGTVLRSGAAALVVTSSVVGVVRRSDAGWRFTLALLRTQAASGP